MPQSEYTNALNQVRHFIERGEHLKQEPLLHASTVHLPLWKQVQLMEGKQTQDDQLKELAATMLVNFGPNNKPGYPDLIDVEMSPLNMLITICEYYIKRVSDLEVRGPKE